VARVWFELGSNETYKQSYDKENFIKFCCSGKRLTLYTAEDFIDWLTTMRIISLKKCKILDCFAHYRY